MADLIQKNETPEPKRGGKIAAAVILIILALFCVLIFFGTQSYIVLIFGGILLIISFILISTSVIFSPYTPEVKQYGNLGERIAGNVLERYLPQDFKVIQNAKIAYGDGVSEIDNIVVGKTGVFIIEVKNMKGTVFADYGERYWVKDKTDQYGYEHEKEFYSPVKQVGTHVYRLANFLRDNKVFTHVNGAVYFPNRETEIVIRGDVNDIPVFTYRNTKAMLNYINSGNANLSEKTVNRIINLIK